MEHATQIILKNPIYAVLKAVILAQMEPIVSPAPLPLILKLDHSAAKLVALHVPMGTYVLPALSDTLSLELTVWPALVTAILAQLPQLVTFVKLDTTPQVPQLAAFAQRIAVNALRLQCAQNVLQPIIIELQTQLVTSAQETLTANTPMQVGYWSALAMFPP